MLNKTAHIHVKTSEQEKARTKKLAKKESMSVSEFIRMLIRAWENRGHKNK